MPSNRSRRTLAAILLLSLLPTHDAAAGPSGQRGTYSADLPTAITDLPVRDEKRAGYKRDKFRHWIDGDRNGCDTRREVLITESATKPTVGRRCAVTGQWLSYYDGKTWTQPDRLDIDHLVPLAEAWDSGASTWTARRREQYANDLTDGRALVAVTDTLNQAKGDADASQWLPPLPTVRCRYLLEWVAVKHRWGLSVDRREQQALQREAGSCGRPAVTVERAP